MRSTSILLSLDIRFLQGSNIIWTFIRWGRQTIFLYWKKCCHQANSNLRQHLYGKLHSNSAERNAFHIDYVVANSQLQFMGCKMAQRTESINMCIYENGWIYFNSDKKTTTSTTYLVLTWTFCNSLITGIYPAASARRHVIMFLPYIKYLCENQQSSVGSNVMTAILVEFSYQDFCECFYRKENIWLPIDIFFVHFKSLLLGQAIKRHGFKLTLAR